MFIIQLHTEHRSSENRLHAPFNFYVLFTHTIKLNQSFGFFPVYRYFQGLAMRHVTKKGEAGLPRPRHTKKQSSLVAIVIAAASAAARKVTTAAATTAT